MTEQPKSTEPVFVHARRETLIAHRVDDVIESALAVGGLVDPNSPYDAPAVVIGEGASRKWAPVGHWIVQNGLSLEVLSPDHFHHRYEPVEQGTSWGVPGTGWLETRGGVA